MDTNELPIHLRDAIEMIKHAAEYASEGLDPKDYIKHRFSDYGFTEHGNTSYRVWMNIAAKVMHDKVTLGSPSDIQKYFQTNIMTDRASLGSYFDNFVKLIVNNIKTKNPALAEELGYS